MSNFGGSKVVAEELGGVTLQEFAILQAAGAVTLDFVVMVGDQFVTDDEGLLVRVEE